MMKGGYLTMAIVALATVSCPGMVATESPLENRYAKAGNRANRATDSHRENPAGATRKLSNDEQGQERWKRAFAPWNGEHSEYQTYTSYSVWKPPVYQLSKPYFIPIYGSSGRIPIYFAPQEFQYPHNPSNTKPIFVGPQYLPPKEYLPPTTESPPETTMTVKTRFDFDDDDDRPVWDPTNNQQPSNEPTRPPPPPKGATTFPPLVHNVHDTGMVHLSAQDEETINAIFNPQQQTTQAPSTQRPTTRRPTSQSRRPQLQGPSGPSNCVWAVVSCCSASTNVYPEKCFEQRGCPGPFWGSSPCDTEFAKAAVEAALNYYNE